MANERTSDRITIKGTSTGLLITLGSGTWAALTRELDVLLGERASFFKGGRVALQVGSRVLSQTELKAMGDVLHKHEVSLWAVESNAPGTLESAAGLGLETIPSEPPAQLGTATAPPQGDSLVVQRTLRSGQVLAHPGHIVVIGDVNPGAEIRAGGSVIVWGRLRGSVHAGLGESGDKAVICALQLVPAQLRIGALMTLWLPTNGATGPEMALIQDNQIIAEPWKG